MKRFRLIVILPLLFFACESDRDEFVCGKEDPLNDLKWLKETKQELERRESLTGSYIIQYLLDGAYVFLVNDCFPCADNIDEVYNCKGELICSFGGLHGLNDCPEFFNTVTDSTMIFNTFEPVPLGHNSP